MKSKTQKIVIVIFKVLRVIAKILFILSIIGAAAMLLSLLTIGSVSEILVNEFNLAFSQLGADIEITVGFVYLCLIIAGLACVCAAVIAKFSEIYLKNVINVGSPFTRDGAAELLRLGIINVAFPIAYSIIVFFATAAIGASQDLPSGISVNVDISNGIALILLSFIFKYAADLIEEKNEEHNEEASSDSTSDSANNNDGLGDVGFHNSSFQ